MRKRLPPRDPRSAHRRKVTAARRIGEDNFCKCGESRPEALISGSNPMVCAKCNRKADEHNPTDQHHIAGEANNPTITIGMPVNDHRAELSTAQQDWPQKTLRNPERSPLLSGAAHIRGFVDTLVYLVGEFLLWVADMLELLDTFLEGKLGPKWWHHTKLKAFEPNS
jgi:hypothetical protein